MFFISAYKCLYVYYTDIFELVNTFLVITYNVCYDKHIKSKGGNFMATVSLTIRIDENDKKIIEQLAKKDDRSISYVVNQAIKEFIRKNAPENKE